MSSRLQLDMRNLSLGRRHLVNAYEVEAGIGVIAANTVIHAWAPWVWGTTKSALYKYTYLSLPLPLLSGKGNASMRFVGYIICYNFVCLSGNRHHGVGDIYRRKNLHDGRQVFSPFWWRYFWGHHEGSKWFFGQFVFDRVSFACVINNCSLMRGRAIHQWILFIAPTQSSTHVW